MGNRKMDNGVVMYKIVVGVVVVVVVVRAGSRGPQAPRHAIWAGPPILVV